MILEGKESNEEPNKDDMHIQPHSHKHFKTSDHKINNYQWTYYFFLTEDGSGQNLQTNLLHLLQPSWDKNLQHVCIHIHIVTLTK